MKIVSYLENRTYMLENGVHWTIPEGTSDTIQGQIYGVENLPRVEVNAITGEYVILSDDEIIQTEEYKDLIIKKNRNYEIMLALSSIIYGYDRLRGTIMKSDAIEKKIAENFTNFFTDTFTSFSNIDEQSNNNVKLDSNKGLAQVIDIYQVALIVTKSIPISANRICIVGEGMTYEYNWGMSVQASNDGGLTWQVVPFSQPNVSDVLTFSSQPTGELKLKMILTPRGIIPEQPVSNKAYIMSYGILY